MFYQRVIGLDLEYGGPVYPTKRRRGLVYDASVLILTSREGTVVYHLYQYQDQNSYVRDGCKLRGRGRFMFVVLQAVRPLAWAVGNEEEDERRQLEVRAR